MTQLPSQNRVRAEVQIPAEMLTKINAEEQLHNHLNAQLMSRIADELHRTKSEAIKTWMVDNHPAIGPQYKAQVELYVFTRQELEDLINRVVVKASIDVAEASFKVNEWKNK